MSEPLAPSVISPSTSKSSSSKLLGVSPRCNFTMYARASASGSGMYTRFSNRRRIAASSSQGTLVAPSTSTCPSALPTPSICTKNSVFTRRAESLSPSDRLPQSESTSSIKMMALPPSDSLASSNRFRTSFSDSPCHLEIKSALLTEKNVESASVATALARYDFPVPGGPNNRIPLKGRRFPVKSCGKRVGRITVSFKLSFAFSRPATSSHLTFGFSDTIAPANAPRNFFFSASSSSSLSPAFFVAEPPVTPFLSSSLCFAM
mmetsp:Transcript_128596/g.191604  ORF Transcript_128596/g.191604 Transcript_128596/m.191604 type:complete len:262 (+) Transcript_128596:462-1247(+)